MSYPPHDVMAVVLARLLRDGERVFVGISSPLPLISSLLARRLHAPNLTLISVTGATDTIASGDTSAGVGYTSSSSYS